MGNKRAPTIAADHFKYKVGYKFFMVAAYEYTLNIATKFVRWKGSRDHHACKNATHSLIDQLCVKLGSCPRPGYIHYKCHDYKTA